jgi:putative FmdB family regulatory protein
MPLYEFKCDECTEDFEKLVRSAAAIDEVVCPTCGSHKVTKRISSFAAQVSGASSAFGNASASSCSTGST